MLRVQPVLSGPLWSLEGPSATKVGWEVPGSRTAAFRPQADGRAHLGLAALAMKTPTFPAKLRWDPVSPQAFSAERGFIQGAVAGSQPAGLVLPQDPQQDPNAF